MKEGRGTFKLLTAKPREKKKKNLLRRPWRRWEDNIRMYLKEISMLGSRLIKIRIGGIREPL